MVRRNVSVLNFKKTIAPVVQVTTKVVLEAPTWSNERKSLKFVTWDEKAFGQECLVRMNRWAFGPDVREPSGPIQ